MLPMIYVKLISGLGNQLCQYAIGRHLSLINNVPLKLDLSFFESQSLRSYKLDKYNINAQIADKAELVKLLNIYEGKNLYAKVFRKLQNKLPKYKRRYFKESEWWSYEQDLFKAEPKVYLDGYWQHYKYYQNINPLIFKELTVNEIYSDSINKLIHEIEDNPLSVSLHIRRGDYITDSDANNLMGVLPMEYYIKAIDYMKNRLTNFSVYVFSDDLNWAESNLKGDFPIKFMDIENGQKDYIELDLMTRCKHNIIANSSFSWWGGFLNKNPDKIVIAPKQWVKPIEINNRIQLQLPGWVKL